MADEKIKGDRAKYLAHIEELKKSEELKMSKEPLEAAAAEGGSPQPDAPAPPSMPPPVPPRCMWCSEI